MACCCLSWPMTSLHPLKISSTLSWAIGNYCCHQPELSQWLLRLLPLPSRSWAAQPAQDEESVPRWCLLPDCPPGWMVW
jgi:hypothetical protein